MRRLVKIVIVLALVLVLLMGSALGYAAYRAVDEVRSMDWSQGLRGVLEPVWCGRKGCLGAR